MIFVITVWLNYLFWIIFLYSHQILKDIWELSRLGPFSRIKLYPFKILFKSVQRFSNKSVIDSQSYFRIKILVWLGRYITKITYVDIDTLVYRVHYRDASIYLYNCIRVYIRKPKHTKEAVLFHCTFQSCTMRLRICSQLR